MDKKILIIDDDPSTTRLVSVMLQRQGYKVIQTNSGPQGINLAKIDNPDLIILDVMMPDMDGYEVARILRSSPECGHIPILIFTAKSQVEDKLAGYESGADDFLSKPIHPVEMVAHIKALLSLPQKKIAPIIPVTPGYVIGIVGAKGGMGVSTATLNLAVTIHKKNKKDVIAAEIIPGKGTWGIELGYADTIALNQLLSAKSSELQATSIEPFLLKLPSGIRLLLASPQTSDYLSSITADKYANLIESLTYLSSVLIIDLADGCFPHFDMCVSACNEILVLTESHPISLQKTRLLLNDLEMKKYGKSKPINVAVYNRVRSDMQFTASQIEEQLGVVPIITIPPAPELSVRAFQKLTPMSLAHSESLFTQQFNRLAQFYIQRMK